MTAQHALAPVPKGRPRNDGAPNALQIEKQLWDDVMSFQHDPEGFVWFAWPWGVPGTPLHNKRPRKWFLELCRDIGEKLRANLKKPENMWDVVQEAIASGHGIGKSSGGAQLLLWALSTFPDTKGVVTANTFNQLRTKTWPEVMKWYGMMINRHWFEMHATSIHHRAAPDSWRADAIPWSENNTEAFQGLHNQGRRIFVWMDEASGIANAVKEVTEGALTDEGTEIVWLAAGNPTRAKGWFRDCFGKEAHLWGHRNIDSRTVEGINLNRIEKWKRVYGEDSQFFAVRVKGQFASADENQLIALEWIADARQRGAAFEEFGVQRKLRISADIAGGGADDTVVTVGEHYGERALMRKQVKKNFPFATATTDAAALVKDLFTAWGGRPEQDDDAVIDSLGVGLGTANTLIDSTTIPVIVYKGGEASSNPAMFRNRRVQSYMAFRNALRDGHLAFAPDMVEDEEDWVELEAQLTSIRSKPGTDKLEDLMTREEMSRNGIDSPDRADSLAMQYATQAPHINHSLNVETAFYAAPSEAAALSW